MVSHRPAHHLAAGQVDHRGQVGPAFPGADIGYVAGPGGVDDDVSGPKARSSKFIALASGSATVVRRVRRRHRPGQAGRRP